MKQRVKIKAQSTYLLNLSDLPNKFEGEENYEKIKSITHE